MKKIYYEKYLVIIILLILFLFLPNLPILAKSSINGIIKDATSQEPLISATVFVEGTKIGTRTNKSGYYSIQNIPDGEYNIRITYLGYTKFTKKITLTNNKNLRLDAELYPEAIKTQEIQVVAEREVLQREITISTVNVPINQIKDIRVGGESDVFRTLQFLPGVLTSSQLSSGLFVRGGSPDQNLVLLDGATIYNPSHLFGFFSTFNTNAIKDVDFIKGGFEAEYGGRLSSVLNVTQKEGNKKEFHGNATIGFISSQAGIEGPLSLIGNSLNNNSNNSSNNNSNNSLNNNSNINSNINSSANSNIDSSINSDNNSNISSNINSNISRTATASTGSFFLSGRRTYLDLILPLVPSDPQNPLPDFYFYDVNAKIVQELGNNDKVSITGFIGRDVLDYGGNSTSMIMRFGNSLLAGKWQHIFNNNLFSTLNVNYSDYGISFRGGESGYGFIIDNSIQDFTIKGDAEWYIKENAAAKIGFEVNKLNFDYLINMTGETDSTANTGDITSTNMNIPDMNYALFAQSKFNITEYLATQIGLRATYFQLNNSFAFDPRIALRYILTGNIALKAAWGLYHQNVRIATMPNFSIVDTWLPSDTTTPISKASHYIFSIETRPATSFDLNFDFYYKTMSGISELNMFTLKSSSVSDVVFIGDAYSYGLEVFLQRKVGDVTGWLGYALGFIRAKFDSINGGRTFRPKYDRLHDFKAVVQYKLAQDWEVGGTFTLQSGQSYTGATSRSRLFIPDQTFGRNKITNSERYGLRLPISHQLNLYGAYEFKMWGKDARVVLDVFNVYNRRDILMRVYNTSEDVTTVEDFLLLPIIPTLSLEVRF